MSQILINETEKIPAKNNLWAEKAIIALTLVGALFKVQHWYGAGILLTIGLSLLAVIYFPFGFYFLGKERVKGPGVIYAFVFGFFLAFTPLGVLFKIMHWPGASALLVVAALSVPFLLAALFFLRKQASPAMMAWYEVMMQRATLIAVIMIFMLLIRMH